MLTSDGGSDICADIQAQRLCSMGSIPVPEDVCLSVASSSVCYSRDRRHLFNSVSTDTLAMVSFHVI